MFTPKKQNQLVYVTIFLITGLALFSLAQMPAVATAKAAVQNDLWPGSFSELAQSVSPAVVNIRTETTTTRGSNVYRHFFSHPFGKNDPFNEFFEKFFNAPHDREYTQRSLGSGFIVDCQGFIVTNNHVVEKADEIKVKLKNGDEFAAEIIGMDAKTDLALLKIETETNLPSLQLGDSDSIRVGEWVVAIGSPFGLEQTVTAGIVSAKGRVIGAGPYDDFIQTDASINPGNSGGPLLNLQGEVVGINTAIVASGQGIGFAIPANLAQNIIEQLKESGRVTRGWLGVGIQPITQELAEYYDLEDNQGALVTQVFPGDPADKAGIEPQDIILQVDGKKIKDNRELSTMIANIPVGETIKIKVLRKGKIKTIPVQIAKRDDTELADQEGGQQADEMLGIRVAALTPEVARELNLNIAQGVYVTQVEAGSRADRAGISRGDVIREINHREIRTTADFREIMKDIKEGERLHLYIRKTNGMHLVINMTR